MKAFLITMIVLLMLGISSKLTDKDHENSLLALGILILQCSLVAWAFYLLVSP